jgi:hypothetical protein
MIATKWKWNEHKFRMKKFQNWNAGCAGFVKSFFDRNFTNFLVWKLTNFVEWKCVSLLWEMNSYNHCFSHPKDYIRGWYSWFFPCVREKGRFSLRKLNLKIQQKRSFLFLPSLFSHRNDSFSCRKIKFSNWDFSKKNCLNWKIPSTRLILLSIQIK